MLTPKQDDLAGIKTLSIGLPKKETFSSKEMMTGICKGQVDEVYLKTAGFMGDGVANTKAHGGPDRAVCFYPQEHYANWEEEFSCKLGESAFGENLTVTGMKEENICLGDVWQIGEAIVEISQGRVPCATISHRNRIPHFLDRIIETGFTGYFGRVIQEGRVSLDSSIRLLERQPEPVSILYANYIFFQDRLNEEGIQRILQVKGLAERWRMRLLKR